jgi:hypothetical protein
MGVLEISSFYWWLEQVLTCIFVEASHWLLARIKSMKDVDINILQPHGSMIRDDWKKNFSVLGLDVDDPVWCCWPCRSCTPVMNVVYTIYVVRQPDARIVAIPLLKMEKGNTVLMSTKMMYNLIAFQSGSSPGHLHRKRQYDKFVNTPLSMVPSTWIKSSPHSLLVLSKEHVDNVLRIK